MSDSDKSICPTYSYNLRPRPRYLSSIYTTDLFSSQADIPPYCNFPEQPIAATTPKSLARQFDNYCKAYSKQCTYSKCIHLFTRPEQHQHSHLIIDDPEFLTVQSTVPTTLSYPEYSIYTPIVSQLPVDSVDSTISSSLPLTTSDTFLSE